MSQLHITIIPELLDSYTNNIIKIKPELVIDWYRSQIETILDIGLDDRINIQLNNISVVDEKLLINFNINFTSDIDEEEKQFLLLYISDMIADPDDDGNYPFIINDDEFLVYSKNVDFKFV